MKALLLLVIGFGLFFTAQSFAQNEAAKAEKMKAVQEAKKITMAFGGALKKELITAMKAGGPSNALDVCNTQAMPITMQASTDHNAIVSRVSLKNRNPNNVPNEWQKKVLEEFDARSAKGESIKSMAFSKIVEENGKKSLHFMKALPTEGACLLCHGKNISKNVQAKLNKLYPDDKAVGYELGQVRGAIVVTKELN